VGPTILNFKTDVEAFKKSECMQDEIFGPLLPVLYYTDMSEAVELINQTEKPLAFSVFGNASEGDQFARSTSSGSLTVNDCILQKAELGLPFGGVGLSGYGRYNGKYSFDEFTHFKPVLQKGLKFDLDARYPPYTEQKKALFSTLHGFLLGKKGLMGLGFSMMKYNISSK
jgi:aldehyde dehydrogenase (NAD+)